MKPQPVHVDNIWWRPDREAFSFCILQPFLCFTYVTAHSLTLLSLLLRHRIFHLRHLASRPCCKRPQGYLICGRCINISVALGMKPQPVFVDNIWWRPDIEAFSFCIALSSMFHIRIFNLNGLQYTGLQYGRVGGGGRNVMLTLLNFTCCRPTYFLEQLKLQLHFSL